jgi:hypothetical protein
VSFTFSTVCFVRRIDKDVRTRPGERVAKRRRANSRIGVNHRINQNETVKWFKNRFEGIVR